MSNAHRLLPVVPLADACLFPECSLEVPDVPPHVVRAVEIARRTGGEVLAVAVRPDGGRETFGVGTIAAVTSLEVDGEHGRLELDGRRRALCVGVVGVDVMVAEVQPIEDGDAGDAWGGAVEALARYVHARPKLREFLDERRRSKEPMAWVNLVAQHLPIKLATRQQLLEAPAAGRCERITRVLEALLQKEQAG